MRGGDETSCRHRIASSMDSDKTQARLLNKIRYFRRAEGKEEMTDRGKEKGR
jgi:hypothetical protein